jgi:bifunctional DNase/RNase
VLIEAEVTSFALDAERNTPVIILQEKNGNRTLPVPIGPLEASAIAIESLDVKPEKPLTIDLAKLIMEQLGGSLRRIVIHDIIDQSLQARIHLSSDLGTGIIECRPSDAIALALRCRVAIFIEDHIFEKDTNGGSSPAQELRKRIRSIDTLEFGKYFLE